MLIAGIGVVVGTCRLNDLISPPKSAILAVIPVKPEQLKDSSAYGSTAPRRDTISIVNEGGGELRWRASVKHASLSPWVTLDPDTGTVSESPPLWVVFDPSGLDSGSYLDTVVVEAVSGSGSLEVPLWYKIQSCRRGTILIDSSVFDSLTAADCAALHRPPGRFAKLYAFSGIVNDSVTIEVSAGFDAYVALDTSLDASRPAVAEADDCLGTPGNPCLYYNRLPPSANYYVEVTSADSGATGPFTLRLLHKRQPNLPDSLDQRLATDSTTPVDPGATISQSSIVLRAVVSDSDLGDTLHLEAEVRPSGTDFSSPTAVGAPVPNESPAYVLVTGLVDNTNYHWRLRAVDQTGTASGWAMFGANPAFNVQTGHDPDSTTALQQLQGNGTTIPVGDVAVSTTVKFSGVVTDQDPGDVLHLEVEVEPVGTPFTDTPSPQSFTTASSGGTSTVTVTAPTLSDGQDYHWQARTVDNSGRAGPWVSFGNNLESDVDFHVTVVSNFNLVFTVQPSQVTAGEAIAPAVTVTAQDQFGQTITSFGGTVTMSIATGPSGGVFSPLAKTTAAATGGVATFDSLIINKAGSYTIQASASVSGNTIFSPRSSSFDVVAAAATRLAFTVQPPPSTTAGVVMAPAIQVSAQDQYGNTDQTFTSPVTMSIAANPGNPPGTLRGTKTVSASNGVAVFSTLSIDKTGAGYTLSAAATGLTPDTSTGFSITPAPATHLTFAVQPSTAEANQVISPAIQVAAHDSLENVVTGFTGNVTLQITAGTGTSGASLTGGGPIAAVSGTALFQNASIDKNGTGYTLTATAATGGLTPAVSDPFDITNSGISATNSSVEVSSNTITASSGSSQTTITVTARDLANNTVGGADVTLSVTPGTGNTLMPNGPQVTNSSGVASWTLSSTKAETKTVSTIINSVSISQQQTVTVNPAPLASWTFTTQPPSTIQAGTVMSPAVEVTGRDAFGNTATGFNGSVTMSLAASPSGDTLSGTKVVSASAGRATFSNIRVRKTGNGYTLQASGGGFNKTSSSFNVTFAPAVRDTFVVQPSTTAVLEPINNPTGVVVWITDSIGNLVTSASNTIAIIQSAGPSGATIGGTTSKPASGGVATFTDLTLDKVGSGYRLLAQISGSVSDISAPFDIVVGPPAKLAFRQQPTNATAGASISPAVTVEIQDANGFVTTSNANVTLAITPGTGTSGAHLSGGSSVTVAAVNGTATFNGLSIDSAGTNYRLSATSGTLTGAASSTFTISAGSASQLAFDQQPSNATAGAAISPAVTVRVLDALGNLTSSGAPVTLAITAGTGTGGAQLSGGTTSASNGVATFSTLTIDSAGTGYRLSATSTGLTQAVSTTFNITAGTATQLVFTTQPTNTTAGAIINQTTGGVVVTARDALGNTATSFTGNVAVAITSGTGAPGAQLSGTKTVAAAGGVAPFSDLSINKAGTGYTLTASATGPGNVASASFNITAGPAAQLVITTQPSSTAQNGVALATQPVVQVEDGSGNPVNQSNLTVTAGVATGPGATLTSNTALTDANGTATFSGLAINGTAGDYTLRFTSGTLTPDTSTTITLSAGAPTQLSFGQQPTSTMAGATISPAVTVRILDADGNLTSSTASVTLAITAGTGTSGAHLSGGPSVTVAAVNGTATFSTLSIDSAGTGYTLTATASGLTSALSNSFTITAGAAAKLAFGQQPTSATAGATISPAVTVRILDANGNPTSSTASVTLAITAGTGTSGAHLSGGPSVTVAAVNGTATFSTLSVDSAGTNYTLTATSGTLTNAISSAFNITVGAPAMLAFGQQPTSATAGATISPAVTVRILDASGNLTSSTANVTLAITAGTGTSGAHLSGGPSVTLAAVNGTATFTALSIDSAGTGYTLTATSGTLTNAISSTFNITAGAAAKLAFGQQPTSTTAGATISPAVTVRILDADGNLTTSTASVTLAITAGTGTGGAHLSGGSSVTVAAVNGTATFSTLSIDSAGTGYTLTATSGTLTNAISNSFDITAGAAAKLAFGQQPSSTTGGATIAPAVTVRILDASGNPTTSTANVTLAITAGTGTSGAHLSGGPSVTVAAVNGTATFSTLSVDSAGTNYTLTATSGTLTNAISSAFNITVGASAKLAFGQQPTSTTGGATIAPAVTVRILDAGGNLTSSTASVTLAITAGTGTSGAHLSGGPSVTVAAVNGTATFSTLSVDSAGTNYTLTATSGTLTNAISSTFDVTVGARAKLAFKVQPPASTVAGVAMSPAIQVVVQDAGGNTVTGNPRPTITIALGANPGSGTLSGTLSVQAGGTGIAVFNDLWIDKAASGYTLVASSGILASATSNSFAITPATAATLVFTNQPTTTAAGAVINQGSGGVVVTALDQFGNTATGFTGDVTLAITANTGAVGAVLSGTIPIAAVAGVATFNDLSINLAGTGYQLDASAAGPTGTTSNAFDITP